MQGHQDVSFKGMSLRITKIANSKKKLTRRAMKQKHAIEGWRGTCT